MQLFVAACLMVISISIAASLLRHWLYYLSISAILRRCLAGAIALNRCTSVNSFMPCSGLIIRGLFQLDKAHPRQLQGRFHVVLRQTLRRIFGMFSQLFRDKTFQLLRRCFADLATNQCLTK